MIIISWTSFDTCTTGHIQRIMKIFHPKRKFALWRQYYMTGALLNVSVLFLRQGSLPSSVFSFHSWKIIRKSIVIKIKARFLDRWSKIVADLRTVISRGVPALAVAVRSHAPLVHESTGYRYFLGASPTSISSLTSLTCQRLIIDYNKLESHPTSNQ